MTSSTDAPSSRVVTSPISVPEATAFTTRLIIFPLRVLGTILTKWISSGVATGPRTVLGPVATPEEIHFVNMVPKTRSGKIMRRVVKAVASGTEIGDVTTLEDGASVDEVKRTIDEFRQSMKS